VEVFYIRADGTRVRGYAFLSHRTIPAQWMVGDLRLDDLKRISQREWFLGGWDHEWEASAHAMVR
jgi:hypothetical protein